MNTGLIFVLFALAILIIIGINIHLGNVKILKEKLYECQHRDSFEGYVTCYKTGRLIKKDKAKRVIVRCDLHDRTVHSERYYIPEEAPNYNSVVHANDETRYFKIVNSKNVEVTKKGKLIK